jgi:hypothetical protein
MVRVGEVPGADFVQFAMQVRTIASACKDAQYRSCLLPSHVAIVLFIGVKSQIYSAHLASSELIRGCLNHLATLKPEKLIYKILTSVLNCLNHC